MIRKVTRNALRASTIARFNLLALAGLLFFSGACGYTLVGQASNLPDDIEEVFVSPLENATSRQQVEQTLTQAIVDELVTRRRFEVISDEGQADAILRGKVVSFEVRPVTFDQNGLATDFEIAITADMRFERPLANGETEAEVIWKNSRYIFKESYEFEDGAPGSNFFDGEDIAIEETSIRFAETLVTDLLEGF